MRAVDIAEQLPTAALGDPVAPALQRMANGQLPSLVVIDDAGRPRVVLSGTQVLRMAVLRSNHRDRVLDHTMDEAHADPFWQELGESTVGECLPSPVPMPIVVCQDANPLDVANLMAREHSPVVAVVDGSGRLVGTITLNRLLSSLTLPCPTS